MGSALRSVGPMDVFCDITFYPSGIIVSKG